MRFRVKKKASWAASLPKPVRCCRTVVRQNDHEVGLLHMEVCGSDDGILLRCQTETSRVGQLSVRWLT